MRLACILLLIPCTLQAQVKAVVDGPKEANPGDLVVLDATDSVGTVYAWTLLQNRVCLPVDGGKRCVFASGTPGVYVFVLSVAGQDSAGKVAIDVAKHSVQIGDNPGPGPTPDPNPPDPGPDPTPEPDLTGTAKVVYDAAMLIDSSQRTAEAKAFARVFRAVASKAAGLTSMTPQEMFAETVKEISQKIGRQTMVKWDSWETAWAAEMRKSAGSTRETHIKAWLDTADGLEAVR